MLRLLSYRDNEDFPDVRSALREPNGLVAVGGNLSPERLINAYRNGIFPWYSSGQPILWWSPDPRAVLYPEQMRISRSLRKTLRKNVFTVTFDRAFRAVVHACAAPRGANNDSWITAQMLDAYTRLHSLGIAHSVESWSGDSLVGGLYGVAIGRVFFGESMFSRSTDASKVATAALTRFLLEWGCPLIDCQIPSNHLASLGAIEIPRPQFLAMLRCWCDVPARTGAWHGASRFRQGEAVRTRELVR
jgi:leucyl/phenylalanyl-tRNA--protein transferase